MKHVWRYTYVLLMLIVSLSIASETLPPICRFDNTKPGLLAAFRGNIQLQDGYGILKWSTGSWQVTHGAASNAEDNSLIRYNTSIKNQSSVAAMPTDADWVARVMYKQTNNQQTAGSTLVELSSAADDILKVCYTGISGTYKLMAGNGSGSGSGSYVEISSFNAAANEFHTLTVHYKAENTKLDFWVDNKLIASDFSGRNGVYGLNFIQIRGGSANISRDCFEIVEIGLPVPSRGVKMVRQRDFTRMGLCLTSNPLDMDEYMGANFNNVLIWKHREGLLLPARQSNQPIVLRYPAVEGATSEVQSGIKSYVTNYPRINAFLVNDEPTAKLMPATGEAVEWIRATYPEKLVYSNAGGEEDYATHIHNFMTIIRPDVLSYDMYPFFPDNADVSDNYFEWMWIIKNKAQEFGVPYWTFIQSYERSSEKYAKEGQSYRLPSESDIRMNIFSSLAYGFTGIQYFTYDPFFDGGILDANYAPQNIYSYIASANTEVAAIGKCLRHLTNTHIFFIPGIKTSSCLPFLEVFRNGLVGSDKIANLSVNSADNDKQNGLIAFFRDDNNQRYFMIVNMWHDENASADSRKLDFNIKFNSGVNSVLRLNRLNGHSEKLLVDPDNGLTVSLPGGTGDLLKYEDGTFAGI